MWSRIDATNGWNVTLLQQFNENFLKISETSLTCPKVLVVGGNILTRNPLLGVWSFHTAGFLSQKLKYLHKYLATTWRKLRTYEAAHSCMQPKKVNWILTMWSRIDTTNGWNWRSTWYNKLVRLTLMVGLLGLCQYKIIHIQSEILKIHIF